MATSIVKGQGTLSDTDLPPEDRGTQGEAEIVRYPQIVWRWRHGTEGAAEIIVMDGEFVSFEYAEMDEEEEMEAMRHLSLKALEGQWDDGEPNPSEV